MLKSSIITQQMLVALNRKILQFITYIPKYNLAKINNMTSKPVEESIKSKLKALLETEHIEVLNESHMHNVPKGSETHFKVVVVSDKFSNKSLIQRHRMVNEILKEELQNGVHALSIQANTPSQWQETDKIIEPSPNCRGGFGR